MASSKVFEIAFKIKGQIEKSFSNGFKNANKQLNDINKKAGDLKKNMESLQKVAAGGLAIGGAGLAGMGYATKQAMAYEDELNNIGVTAGMTTKELKKLDDQAMSAAMGAGLKVEEVIKGAGDLVAKGMSKDVVGTMLGSLTNTVVASRASMEDVANVTFTLNDALGVTADKMEQVHGILITAGKEGAFEYNKMAQFIPNLGAKYKAMGIQGTEAAASMGAALQVAYKGTGNADMAANNFANFLSKINSPQMIKAASKMGFDMQKAMNDAVKKGENPIDAVMEGIHKVTKGGRLDLLGQIASDQQVKDFLLPMMQNMPEYYKIKKEAMEAQNVVAMDALKQGSTAAASWSSFQNQLSNSAIVVGQALTPAVTVLSQNLSKVVLAVEEWRKENPELFNTLVKIATVVFAVIAAISGFSLVAIAVIGPILMMGSVITKIIGIVKLLNLAFLTNPIVLIVMAIIGVIALLYFNWDKVSKFLVESWEVIKSVWSSSLNAITGFVQEKIESIKGFFTSGIGNISATIVNWSPLGLFYKAFAGVMNWFGVSLPGKFTEFGKNLLQGLANGIRNGVSAAVNAAGEAVEAVKSKVKDFFGIHSPSRVFAEFGMYNMQGLANGMTDNAGMAEKASLNAVSGALPTGSSLTNNNSSSSSSYNITLNLTGGSNVMEQAKTGTMDAIKQIEAQKRKDMRTSFA